MISTWFKIICPEQIHVGLPWVIQFSPKSCLASMIPNAFLRLNWLACGCLFWAREITPHALSSSGTITTCIAYFANHWEIMVNHLMISFHTFLKILACIPSSQGDLTTLCSSHWSNTSMQSNVNASSGYHRLYCTLLIAYKYTKIKFGRLQSIQRASTHVNNLIQSS